MSSNVEGDVGVTLLTIPKNLTLNKMRQITDVFRQEYSAHFISTYGLTQEFGTIQTDSTYRVLITNSWLKKSRELSFHEKGNLLANKKYEMSRTLEVVALVMVTYMSSRQSLYNRSYTCCQDDGALFFVGGFTSIGFNVSAGLSVPYGVGAVLRKF